EGFVNALAHAGFQVLRFDHRDTGLSTHLVGLRAPDIRLSLLRRGLGLPIAAPYGLMDMARDAVGLLDAVGWDRAHVMGMSMGGMIAQTMAIEYPDRVRSLVSFASSAGDLLPLPRPRALGTLVRPPARTREQAIETGMTFLRVCGSRGIEWDEEEARRVWGACWDRDPSHDPGGFVRQFTALLAAGSRSKLLSRIRCPTLVLHGLEDPLLPPAAAMATARAIPGAMLQLVPGLGHDLPRGAWSLLVEAVSRHARGADRRLAA
ncbi:MAG: alpha/beta fold hydrolase, partial [Polyangia bacterium]|nr:alpha/beta fold hydrolase [Polyangia bacterium]